MITINMSKAKDIWKDRIRQARTSKLEALDVEFQRALESGDTQKQQEVAQKKQWFRDLPSAPEIANATTIDELKSFWPDELN